MDETRDDAHDDAYEDAHDEAPEFGPSGYLPERASKRARKIILRAPLGLQWIVASLVLGVALVAAVLLLTRATDPPEAPFAALPGVTIEADGLLAGASVGGTDVVVLRVAGPQAFLVPDGLTADDLAYCDASGLVEAAGDDLAWRPSGRGVNDTPSLLPVPTVVHEGDVYADPTAPGPPATPDADGPSPACG